MLLAGLALPLAPLHAQTPAAQDDARKAAFDQRLAENKQQLRDTPYADKEGRIALLADRAKLTADFFGDESIEHADALQLLAFEYYSARRLEIGRASGRERVGQYVYHGVVAVSLKK